MQKVYSFQGYVIRLAEKDYTNWLHSFASDVPEQVFYDKLLTIDAWMHKKGIKGKHWFFVASDILAKWKREREKAQR